MPWNEYGLIVHLAARMQEENPQFGKTALQQLVYLAQELKKIPSQYQFSLYNYGPYCNELAGDLDYLDAIGGVEVSLREGGLGGYVIKPGKIADFIQKLAQEFLAEHTHVLNSIVKEFGGYQAKELELFATIVYVYRFAKNHNIGSRPDEILTIVEGLKPHFSRDPIQARIGELQEKEFMPAG